MFAREEHLQRQNNYYTSESSNQYSQVQKLNDAATSQWIYYTNHGILISCSRYMTGATRRGRRVIKGLNDFVGLSDGQDDPNTVNSSSVYMERISMTGQPR